MTERTDTADTAADAASALAARVEKLESTLSRVAVLAESEPTVPRATLAEIAAAAREGLEPSAVAMAAGTAIDDYVGDMLDRGLSPSQWRSWLDLYGRRGAIVIALGHGFDGRQMLRAHREVAQRGGV